MLRESYRINTPAVVLEVFDDEVILVNLDQGAYYSADGAGGRIVSLLNDGAARAELLRVVRAEFDGAADLIESATDAFLGSLETEGLIVTSDLPGSRIDIRPGPPRPFREPALQKYTDLRDLLLLDPIHDVDEAGWPVAKTPGA